MRRLLPLDTFRMARYDPIDSEHDKLTLHGVQDGLKLEMKEHYNNKRTTIVSRLWHCYSWCIRRKEGATGP